ncbi:MAG: hypothetical protein ACREOR_00025 [Candidatus Binatia bacterium]
MIDVNLGGGLIKKRVALPGRGQKGEHPNTGGNEPPRSMVLCIWFWKE